MSESRRKTLTLIAAILGSNIVFLDGTVVNVALPSIQRDLDTGLAAQQWVVEGYLLTLVAVLLVGGSLGDLYGRRRLFLIGLVGFGITSILCALAPSSGFLIAARALQGIAGALLVPGSLAIIAATYEDAGRGKAVGTWTAWAGVSTLIGPAGGGLLIDVIDWRAIFWINIPLIAATVWLTRRAVRESSDPEACPGVDYVGIGLSAGGLGGIVFALIQEPASGWGSVAVLGPLIAGALSLGAFLAWERRTHAPMLPLSLFGVRNFAVANASTLAVYAGLFSATFFLTIFLQQVSGYSPLEAGLATLPVTVIMFFLSPRFGALAGGVGPRLPMGLGPIIAGAGLLLMTRVDAAGDYLADVLPGVLVFSLGLAMTVAPLTATVLDSVPERRAGIASGVNNAVSRVAGLFAIAVIGAVIAAQYGDAADDALAERSLGPGAAAAVRKAEESPFAGPNRNVIPEAQRRQVEQIASEAAVEGFRAGLGLAGLISILGGVIAAVGIRNPEKLPDPGPAPV